MAIQTVSKPKNIAIKPSESTQYTSLLLDESDMAALEAAAHAKSEVTFLIVCRKINWAKRSERDFVHAVDLALMAGAHTAAQNLAIEGFARFPNHTELKKMASVLAPPTTKNIKGNPNTTWEANRNWLKTHWDEYQGQWVALRNGELLAANESLDILSSQIGDVKGKDILLARMVNLLTTADGESFTTGSIGYLYQPATRFETTDRIMLPVEIESIPTIAALDTGSPYVICTPRLSQLLRLDPAASLERKTLLIRGSWVTGSLHHLTIGFIAEQGENLLVDAIVFVPDPDWEESWDDLPTFIGLSGCLARMRFAVDPRHDMFYFGQA